MARAKLRGWREPNPNEPWTIHLRPRSEAIHEAVRETQQEPEARPQEGQTAGDAGMSEERNGP
jgi:hypothetical protein